MINTGTLAVTTPTDREIVMTRVFDAPRALVFDAFSKPETERRIRMAQTILFCSGLLKRKVRACR